MLLHERDATSTCPAPMPIPNGVARDRAQRSAQQQKLHHDAFSCSIAAAQWHHKQHHKNSKGAIAPQMPRRINVISLKLIYLSGWQTSHNRRTSPLSMLVFRDCSEEARSSRVPRSERRAGDATARTRPTSTCSTPMPIPDGVAQDRARRSAQQQKLHHDVFSSSMAAAQWRHKQHHKNSKGAIAPQMPRRMHVIPLKSAEATGLRACICWDELLPLPLPTPLPPLVRLRSNPLRIFKNNYKMNDLGNCWCSFPRARSMFYSKTIGGSMIFNKKTSMNSLVLQKLS